MGGIGCRAMADVEGSGLMDGLPWRLGEFGDADTGIAAGVCGVKAAALASALGKSCGQLSQHSSMGGRRLIKAWG